MDIGKIYTACDVSKDGDMGCEIKYSFDRAGNVVVHDVKFTKGE